MHDLGSDRWLLPPLTARDLALTLFKRKWGVLAVLVSTIGAFFGWLFLIHDDSYRVAAKVLVKIGREQAPPPSVMGVPPMVIAYRSQDVNSEIDIFQSSESVVQVVDELKLYQPVPEVVPASLLLRLKYEAKRLSRAVKDAYEEVLIRVGLRERLGPREKAIFGVQQALQVKVQKDSNVFVAELVLPYRQGSARVLNALLDHYLVNRQRLFQVRETSFFQSAVDEAQIELHAAEAQLQRFENQGGITEIAKQEALLLEHVAAARLAWKQMDFTRQEFLGRVERLEREVAKDDPDFAGVGEFTEEGFQQTVLKQMAELQRQRAALRLTELDGGERIRNNRQQFGALAAMLTANLRASLAEKEQQTALRRTSYEGLEEQLRLLHEKKASLVDLQRRARDQEQTYLLYRKKLEEATADDAMLQSRVSNVAVIERATDPLAPVGMRKTTLLALALIGAILAALSWVTIGEFFDQGIYTVEDLQQRLSAPVLAAIPPAGRLRGAARTIDGILQWPSAADEEYRRAALQIATATRASGHRSVLLSSATRGEGTSTSSINVARLLGQGFGVRAVVVETNRLQPVYARMFELDDARSLAAVESGAVAVSQAVQQGPGGVSIVPRGDAPGAPVGADPESGLARAVRELEGQFDLVLLDAPPILECADVLALGRLVPRLVLIAEAGEVTRQSLGRVLRQLRDADIELLGVILNSRKRVIPEWLERRLGR
jgi:uncharacterized protein involved in exopolysaccharide biosynthesis/Mrp family chromosome partitioning ATPase